VAALAGRLRHGAAVQPVLDGGHAVDELLDGLAETQLKAAGMRTKPANSAAWPCCPHGTAPAWDDLMASPVPAGAGPDSLIRPFPAQGREQDHVADAGAVGQQHHQPVNADAAAAGGGHAVFQRAHEVVVVEHGFVVAAVLGCDLRLEARGLVFGVVQLAEKPLPNSRPVM
jgi:hypothetical protein